MSEAIANLAEAKRAFSRAEDWLHEAIRLAFPVNSTVYVVVGLDKLWGPYQVLDHSWDRILLWNPETDKKKWYYASRLQGYPYD